MKNGAPFDVDVEATARIKNRIFLGEQTEYLVEAESFGDGSDALARQLIPAIGDTTEVILAYEEKYGNGADYPATLQRDLWFGGTLYPEGSDVDSSSESKLLRLGYSYSLMRDGQKELGLTAGLT